MTPCPVCGKNVKRIESAKHFPDPGTAKRKDICIALGVPQGTFNHIETRRRMCLSHFDEEDFKMYRNKRVLNVHALPRELTQEEKEFLLNSDFNIRRHRQPKNNEVIAVYGKDALKQLTPFVKNLPTTSSTKEKVIKINGRLNGNQNVGRPDSNQQVTINLNAGNKEGSRKRKLSTTPKFDIKVLSPVVNGLLSTSQANTSLNGNQKVTTGSSVLVNSLPSTSSTASDDCIILEDSNVIQKTDTSSNKQSPVSITPKFDINVLSPVFSAIPSTSQANNSSNGIQKVKTQLSAPAQEYNKKPRVNTLPSTSSPANNDDCIILEDSNVIEEDEINSSKQQPPTDAPAPFKVIPLKVSNIKVLSFPVDNLSLKFQANNDNSEMLEDLNVIQEDETSSSNQQPAAIFKDTPLTSNIKVLTFQVPSPSTIRKRSLRSYKKPSIIPSSSSKSNNNVLSFLVNNQSPTKSQPKTNALNLNNNDDQEMDTSSNTNLLLARCIQYSHVLPNDSDQRINDDVALNSTVEKEDETVLIKDVKEVSN